MAKREWVFYGKVVKVVDGDTLDVDTDLGFDIKKVQRFRLYGIDTPETYGVKKSSEEYKAGMLAKNRVKELLSGKEVKVVSYKNKKGKYGRYLSFVYLPGEELSINDLLLEEHLAKKYGS